MRKGQPIGGLRVTNAEQGVMEAHQINIRLSNPNIPQHIQLRQVIPQNNQNQIQNVHQEQNDVQEQNPNIQQSQQQIQNQSSSVNEQQNENRRRNRTEGGNSRGSGRKNNRNRIDLD